MTNWFANDFEISLSNAAKKTTLQANVILDRLTFQIPILYYYLFLLKLDMTLIYCKLTMENNGGGLNWPKECRIIFRII
jgi:hypothetical protein